MCAADHGGAAWRMRWLNFFETVFSSLAVATVKFAAFVQFQRDMTNEAVRESDREKKAAGRESGQ